MSHLIFNLNNAILKKNMAAFDYDWTVVCPKDGKTFPNSIEDWEWLYPDIIKKIRKYNEMDYMVVFFTNQSKPWKYDQIKIVLNLLEIPLFIVIAIKRDEYKPNINLFKDLVKEFEINKSDSFFVGDALGRKGDHSDCDRLLAENIGIRYYSPEKFFVDKKPVFEIPNIKLNETPEMIIMIGYPGSGKSTIANNICKSTNYVHIFGDKYKTSSKMKKAAMEHINEQKSIVFDATNSSKSKRKEYIDFANKYGYNVRCIHMNTSLEVSYKRNKLRSDKKQVPKIAYSVYKKYYEEPNESEGFKLITI
jgi:bifunctional polynucleotide phosphatase/kinase